MTNLLDVLKETDLRLNITNEFKTLASRESLPRETIQRRLILALYGLGTNTGLKRISAGNHGESYSDLLYIRRKFINKDNLRNAISKVVNAILAYVIQKYGVKEQQLVHLIPQKLVHGIKIYLPNGILDTVDEVL